MAKTPYAKAIDEVLQPLGFIRSGDDWKRVRGDLQEVINRQSFSGGPGVNVNFYQWDLQTARLASEVLKEPIIYTGAPLGARLDLLTYGRDYWWTGTGPDGPPALTAALLKYGLPWFDRVRNLEDQLELWFDYEAFKGLRSSFGHAQVCLALTLYRLGRVEEARGVMNKPIPKRAPKESYETLEQVRHWLGHPPRTRAEAERQPTSLLVWGIRRALGGIRNARWLK